MEMFYIFAGITILGLIAYGLQIWAVRSTLRTGKGRGIGKDLPFPLPLPAVSILKPLKGLDDNLFDNLASFCTQDYPEYEIIFSLQDHNDPAYKVARKIKDKYHEKNISIIVEKCDVGLNPKVNNLMSAYKVSQYEHILISDSNVMVDKDYLKEIVKHMKEDVGLVSNVIRGIGGSTIGSIFENLHLNTFILGSVCFLDKFLKMPCVVGKSMLMRKNDLEAIGGFKAVKDVLAEDYVIGERIHKMGKKVVLSNYAINNVNEYWGIRRFLNRHTRWGKLRWRLGGIKYISELIGNPVFMSFIPMMLWEISRTTVSFALFVSLIKVIGDLYLGKITDSDSNPMVYLLSPVKDMIIGLIWFVPILSNTVVWRGNRYIIGRDSMLSPCPETGMWAWRYRIVDAIKARIA
ncbi:ceramide glucosyltransferase [Dissulfurispira sp.]|uniref:ceramide glucosyltransferase n=1 Tax=Dissulfurispira sp. TaxID=2817609 RepID=UPI002FD9BB3D